MNIRKRYLTTQPETKATCLQLHLHLSGFHELGGGLIGAGQYGLFGNGLLPRMAMDVSDQQPFLEVVVDIREDVFRSFISDVDGELLAALQLWVRPVEQQRHRLLGTATPVMHLAARRMLQCGFQGLPKRMFLEGKSLELLVRSIPHT